ncbi:MAG: hypothetical protein KGI37_05960 [Alphaproteobacteria bacterium]|nr:hypothetical protein [Alphaproteobacteria bacterium]
MTRRSLPLLAALLMLATPAAAQADGMCPPPDDTVSMTLNAEDWVTSKTAHVTLNVEAAVNAATAGAMRADMTNAVNTIAKGDWRLIGFSRSEDQTGMDRWSARFDARLPESALGNLSDAAKKASKAGMQITVGDIDFAPTLDETETARAALRAQLYKNVLDQLAALNAALPGRAYHIARIIFAGADAPAPRMMRRPMMMAMAAVAPAAGTPDQADLQPSEKLAMTADVTYAAAPPEPKAAMH